MHCPYCNSTLTEHNNGELRCSATGAWFSGRLTNIFKSRYAQAQSVDRQAEPRLPGSWFCPGCGVRMATDGCHLCGQSFELEIVRHLIELNPHPWE